MLKKINEIHKSIVGNGIPGLSHDVQELKLIQKAHVDTLKRHSEILDKLNIRMAYYAGAIAVIVFIITVITKHFGLL